MANLLRNPIVDMYQTQLEASRRFADVLFSGTEKIDHAVIGATHRAFTEQLNFVQAIASARNPQGVANVQSTYFSRRPESAVNYQKEMIRIFAEVQNEIGRSVQDCVEKFGENVANQAWSPMREMQGRAEETLFNPITSMLSAWESALSEVTALTNKNIAVARSSYDDAIHSTATATTTVPTEKTTGGMSTTSRNGASDSTVYEEAAMHFPLHTGEAEARGDKVVEEKRPYPSGKRK